MSETITGPQCGFEVAKGYKFCTNCGCRVVVAEDAVKVTITPQVEDKPLSRNIMDQIQMIGSKAQSVVTGEKTTEIVGKAKQMTEKASLGVSPEKATQMISSLVTLMIQVARDVKSQIPPEMVKAIDLEAEVSFVAFSVGVSIDLEQITAKPVD
jgi:hypothetical protein